MATEASPIDQEAHKLVEEMKLDDDTKHVNEESVSQPKFVEEKNEEEKLKAEDSTSVAASVTEQKENSDNGTVALVEDVKKEEAKEEPTGEATEKEPEAENSEVSLVQESESEAAEEVKTKDVLPSASETEVKETESALDVSAAPEASESSQVTADEKILAEVVVSPEPSKEETSSDEISIQVAAASDSSDAISVNPAEVNEVKDDGAIVSEVPDVPEKTGDNPNADDGVEESVKEENVSGETQVLKKFIEVEEKEEKATEGEEPMLSEAFKEKIVTEVTQVSPEGGGAENSEKNKTESLGGDKTSLVESSKDPDSATVAEVSSEGEKAPGGVDLVEEDVSLEGDKTTLVETSRDVDVDSTVNVDSKEVVDSEPKAAEEALDNVIDKSVNVDSEDKNVENENVGNAKDDDHNTKTEGEEAPKEEVPVKSSQHQSNKILSKMKQAIIKVKKAIVGKSSNPKTISAEGKDDIKAN